MMSSAEGSVGREVAVSDRKTCVAVRRDDVVPVCPYCETDLPEIHVRTVRGAFGMGRGFVMTCPSCRKVLGTAAQWYPFPG
jgi:ABC-type ATPase with predicted acetyltransferase domain